MIGVSCNASLSAARIDIIFILLRIDSEQAEEELFRILHSFNARDTMARERLEELLVECNGEWFGQQSILRPSIIRRLIKEYAVKASRESKKWGALQVLAGVAHLAAARTHGWARQFLYAGLVHRQLFALSQAVKHDAVAAPHRVAATG